MSLHKKWGVTHHEARMSTSNFWTAVDQAGWSRDHNYKRIKELFLERFTQREADAFRATFQDLQHTLGDTLSQWAEDNDKEFGLGDDSWGDFLAHIIGMGKHEYDVVMRDPDRGYERAVNGSYKESFSYGIPYKDDYAEKARQPQSKDTLDVFGGWALPDNFRRNLIQQLDADIKGLQDTRVSLMHWYALNKKTSKALRSTGTWANQHRDPSVDHRTFYDWTSSDLQSLLQGNSRWGEMPGSGFDVQSILVGIDTRIKFLVKIIKELESKRPSGA